MTDDELLAEARAIALELRLTQPARLGNTPIYDALYDRPAYRNTGRLGLSVEAGLIHAVVLAHRSDHIPITKEALNAARAKAK